MERIREYPGRPQRSACGEEFMRVFYELVQYWDEDISTEG